MGTTLTGTTPQDTYDSLIKVTDNGPISGTAKYLSDGLGNDSALALSTTQVGVGTNNPQGILHAESAAANMNLIAPTGNGTFRISNSATSATRKEFTAILDTTNNRVDIQAIHQGVATFPITINAGGGNVGIGTSAPAFKLDVVGTIKANENAAAANGNGLVLRNQGGGGGESVGIVLSAQNQQANSQIRSTRIASSLAEDIQFFTGTNNVSTEKARILAGGGITFNGDTAAANALDDYEEGTWTPSVNGTTGTATYSVRDGYYTKIGRQVVVQFFISFQKNTITGGVNLSGLPYTVGNLGNQFPQAVIMFDNLASAYNNPLLQLANNATTADVITGNGTTGSHAAMQDTQLGPATMAFRGTATYFV